MCQDSKAAAKFKFVATLMGNTNIETLILIAFVQTFELRENMTVDGPLILRCDLAIDSDDLVLIFRLASREKTPEDFPGGVQGMLQIKSFTPLDPNVAIMDPTRWKTWQIAKAKKTILMLRDDSVVKIATGLIEFHMEGTDQILIFPVHIHNKEVAVINSMSGEIDIISKSGTLHSHINITPMATIMSVIFLDNVDIVLKHSLHFYLGLSMATSTTIGRMSFD